MARTTSFCGELELPRPYIFRKDWVIASKVDGKRCHKPIAKASTQEIADWNDNKRDIPKDVIAVLANAVQVASVSTTKELTTVSILIERYKQDVASRVQQGLLEQSTQEGILKSLKSFETAFGSLTLGQVSLDTVAKWRSLNPAWGVNTYRQRRASVHKMFAYAVSIRALPVNPISGGESLKAVAREYVLTDSDITAIVANASPAFSRFYRFCVATGCRPSEAASLTRLDVETLTGGYITRRKGKTSRKTGRLSTLVCKGIAAELIAEALENATDDAAPLFPTPTGSQWTRDNWSHTLCAIKAKAGLDDNLDLYASRSKSICAMLDRGVSAEDTALFHNTSYQTIERFYLRNGRSRDIALFNRF